MNDLPTIITKTQLWETTLAQKENDQQRAERERLRSTFITFRERTGQLAIEIRKDLPELTVHDLSHLDALWEIASTVVGQNYFLTPTEAFVLAGAILLHDLAMSIAATEGGYRKLVQDPRWKDLITLEYQLAYERNPTQEELVNPDSHLQKKVLFNLLRQIHAENAEKLAFLSFKTTDGTPIFLIDDPEIRQAFGRVIGQVAHSHWWSINDVEKNFSRVIGAPHWCPPEWTIDPLKAACILRLADAAHLDGRRAPTFLKAFSNISRASEEHWIFQEKLNKPYLGEDALVFTTGRAFRLNEASAWWVCLDTLRLADRELRSVDALFAEKGYPRFAAKRVAGVDSPERLASYIHTDSWLPINATVHVTDLPGIIKSIGGKELYGEHPEVALRELVQNACDAIKARRIYEKRDEKFGKISIKLIEENTEHWLIVEDTGIGMSQKVLTDFLLDFGRSFWGSPQMQEELPGLLSSGIKSIGKYGIGFFSVFMISSSVQVATRRSDLAARETLVLEFSSGLEGRPILRPADRHEQLLDGGTRVKAKLKNHPYKEGGLLYILHNERTNKTLEELCKLTCPAIESDLTIIENNHEKIIVNANDWLSIDGIQLLNRMQSFSLEGEINQEDLNVHKEKVAKNLRLLKNEDGQIVGRAFINPGYAWNFKHSGLLGVVTIGGLEACSLAGICGVLVGQSIRASREDAKPIVSNSALKLWAEEQAELVPDVWSTPEEQVACAQYIWMCGGETKKLPICKYQNRWVSAEDIVANQDLPSKIIFIDSFDIRYKLELLNGYTLRPNIFITANLGIPGLLNSQHIDWPLETHSAYHGGRSGLSLFYNILQAVAKSWKVSFNNLLEANDLEYKSEVEIGQTDDGRKIEISARVICKP